MSFKTYEFFISESFHLIFWITGNRKCAKRNFECGGSTGIRTNDIIFFLIDWHSWPLRLGFVADRHKAGPGGQMLALKVIVSHPATLVPVCEGWQWGGHFVPSLNYSSTLLCMRDVTFRPIFVTYVFIFFFTFVIINSKSIKIRDNAKEVKELSVKILVIVSFYIIHLP